MFLSGLGVEFNHKIVYRDFIIHCSGASFWFGGTNNGEDRNSRLTEEGSGKKRKCIQCGFSWQAFFDRLKAFCGTKEYFRLD